MLRTRKSRARFSAPMERQRFTQADNHVPCSPLAEVNSFPSTVISHFGNGWLIPLTRICSSLLASKVTGVTAGQGNTYSFFSSVFLLLGQALLIYILTSFPPTHSLNLGELCCLPENELGCHVIHYDSREIMLTPCDFHSNSFRTLVFLPSPLFALSSNYLLFPFPSSNHWLFLLWNGGALIIRALCLSWLLVITHTYMRFYNSC